MSVTFCTIIRDKSASSLLWEYGANIAKARHWSFKQIHALGRSLNDVKREAQVKFEISARQFNGIKVELDQHVNAWKGGLKYRIDGTQESIVKTQEKIKKLQQKINNTEKLIASGLLKTARYEKNLTSFNIQIRGKKLRLDVLKGRLNKIQNELNSKIPKICFGGREYLRFDSLCEWKARRESRIFLVGSKDEKAGNQICQWNGEALKLRLPYGFQQDYLVIPNLKFRYGQERLTKALAQKQAITWLIFFADDGFWHAHATIDELPAEKVTDCKNGVIAVDVNDGHLAVTAVDGYGNPTSKSKLPFPQSGTDAFVSDAIVGDAVKQICEMAKDAGYGIACEDLDFKRKKSSLREQGKNHAVRLSGWAYAKFFQILSARCAREGIELRAINPAYTSKVGKMKYARCRAMSTHHAAALVIGRQAMGYGERFVTMDGSGLTSPARMMSRNKLSRWRNASLLPRETLLQGKAARTAGWGFGQNDVGSRLSDASVQVGIPGRRRTALGQIQVGDAVVSANRVNS